MYYLPGEGYPQSNPDSLPSFPSSLNCVNEDIHHESFQNHVFLVDPISSNDLNYHTMYQVPYPNEDVSEIPDFPDACLKFINDILMEEGLNDRPTTLQDYDALQATEKSLYDALGETYSPSSDQWPISAIGQSIESTNDQWISSHYYADNENVVESNWLINQNMLDMFQPFDDSHHALESSSGSTGSCNRTRMNQPCKSEELVNGSKRENSGHLEERSCKQLADYNEEYVEMEKYDDVLICKEGNDDISPNTRKSSVDEVHENSRMSRNSRQSKRKSKSSRGKKKSNKGEMLDLRTLLIQCAQAVASFELINANELLQQVRQHASPFGDSVQRVAHYFADGLEARLAGKGSDLYKDIIDKQISSSDILKAYKLYVSAIPFQRTSYFLTNQTISKLAEKKTRIHIIDFGIHLGFQWPCLIQNLSRRPFGPPRLRITGVDYPKSGFKPARQVEETGRRLAGYCQRFGVPFEYNAIAQRWHTIKPEDFRLERDELVVVTCLYQSRKLPDESVDVNSPRDCFLRLIRSLNPDIFIHGVVNGTFNAPFFVTRFREALYHYSSLFDVFEATIAREDHDRLLIENYLYGKDAMNIVACEETERVERPETYKQWQVRKKRAGFKQVSLHQEVVNRARAMVKANYHKDFMVEQDRDWMVQGWKGRILSAISCWKPC